MTRRIHCQSKSGFTLVEIMIVVLIIGVLLAIAVPNFVNARETSRAKACVGNLKQIDSATEQWCIVNNISSVTYLTGPNIATQLVGPTNFLRSIPVCPSGGNYAVSPTFMGVPSCSITGPAGSGYEAPAGATPAGKWWHGLN